MPLTLYLRVRTVEWDIAEHRFECVVDEVLGDLTFSESHEVRGSARIEEHYVALQKTFTAFGFDVVAGAAAEIMALHKRVDGNLIEGIDRVRI